MKRAVKLAVMLWTVVVLTAICAGQSIAVIPSFSTNPDDFVQPNMEHFWLNGQEFRFIGFNMRGGCHYGYGDVQPEATHADREADFAYMESIGAKVARIFISCKYVNSMTVAARLNYTAYVAAQHNIRLICAFTDLYDTGLHPMGDEVYYVWDGFYVKTLGTDFFAGGYVNNYLPNVQYIVNQYKNDPRIFAWEVGNELKTYPDQTLVIPFAHATVDAIKAIDQLHMVTFGGANRSFNGLEWNDYVDLYEPFDFITIHSYNNDDMDDSGFAGYMGKPYIIEEAGFSSGTYSDRPSETNADISKWLNRRARGYMNWGLMAVTHNNGDGDGSFGIDRYWHNYDWDEYTTVFSTWASVLNNSGRRAPEPPTRVQATEATWVDRVVVTWHEMMYANEYAVFRADSPVGTKTQVSSWQASPEFHDTSVQPGKLYCYWVKARNEYGPTGFGEYDAGYASNASAMTVAQAKGRVDQTPVYVTGGTVTAVFDGEFYIQQPDRATAIGVVSTETVNEGDQVDVFGKMTTVNGERKINALSIYP